MRTLVQGRSEREARLHSGREGVKRVDLLPKAQGRETFSMVEDA